MSLQSHPSPDIEPSVSSEALHVVFDFRKKKETEVQRKHDFRTPVTRCSETWHTSRNHPCQRQRRSSLHQRVLTVSKPQYQKGYEGIVLLCGYAPACIRDANFIRYLLFQVQTLQNLGFVYSFVLKALASFRIPSRADIPPFYTSERLESSGQVDICDTHLNQGTSRACGYPEVPKCPTCPHLGPRRRPQLTSMIILASPSYMLASPKVGGPQNRPQYTTTLIMGTPKFLENPIVCELRRPSQMDRTDKAGSTQVARSQEI